MLERDEFRMMFLDDLSTNGGRSMRAFVYDAILFTREWGFSARDVRQPVTWWHGDADNIVPLAHAEHLVPVHPATPRCGCVRARATSAGLGAAREVLDAVLSGW